MVRKRHAGGMGMAGRKKTFVAKAPSVSIPDYKFVINPVTGQLDRVVNNLDILKTEATNGSVLFVSNNALIEDNTNLFYDNSNNRLGIRTASPVSTLDLNGSMSVATIEKTGNYTLTNLDYFINCDASGGSFTITLPVISGNEGRVYHIKKKDFSGNSVTIDGNGAETIDGGATAVLTMQYESIKIVNDGTEWWIL